MPEDAAVCRWCEAEGLDPTPGHGVADADPLAWDGQGYLARRRRRISAPDGEGLRLLLAAVLADGEQLADVAIASRATEANKAASGKGNELEAITRPRPRPEEAPMTW